MFKELSYWIRLNKEKLLEFWYDEEGKLDGDEVKKSLTKFPHDWKITPINEDSNEG